MRKTGRCYVCLRRGHMLRGCRSTTRCYKCKGKHHSSICTTDLSKDPVQRVSRPAYQDQVHPSAQPQPSTSQGLNPNAQSFPSSTLQTMANQSVLLQTALMSIYNPGKPQKVTNTSNPRQRESTFLHFESSELRKHCTSYQKISAS